LRRNLTNNRLPGSPYHTRWSPDGNKIVFECEKDIYIMDENGDNLDNLTNSEFVDWAPCWSPNGEKIAFSSAREDDECHIYVMNPDGSDIERLTNNKEEEKILVDWRSGSTFGIEMIKLLKAIRWGEIKTQQ